MIEHTENAAEAEMLVVLNEQADLSGAELLPNQAERARFVWQRLVAATYTTPSLQFGAQADANGAHTLSVLPGVYTMTAS
ncbi:MAG: hypothetical protein HC853_07600, partial [Anaerolineae bacterium]|nr:hypothetical protein [Anaerolineae bacterium]